MNVAFLFHDSVSTTATTEKRQHSARSWQKIVKKFKLFLIIYNWVFKGSFQLSKNVTVE